MGCGLEGAPTLEGITASQSFEHILLLRKLQGLLHAVVLDEVGTAICAAGMPPPDCLHRLTNAEGIGDRSVDFGSYLQPIHPVMTDDQFRPYLVVQSSTMTRRLVTMEEIADFLAPVDTPTEAAFLAALVGLRFQCGDPNFFWVAPLHRGGYEVAGLGHSRTDLLLGDRGCAPLLRLRVSRSGRIEVLSQRNPRPGDPDCH